ncbi:MAG: hypothetical protein ACKOSS_01325 [Planctomycetia bacterium]
MVWKIAKVGRASTVTGEVFPPDTPIVTALFGEELEASEDKVRGTGFVRRDFLASEATPERLEGAYCVWRTRTPPAVPASRRPLDLDLAREMLERLLREGDGARAGVAMALALVLARKRRLVLLEQGETVLKVRWPKDEATFEVPAPILTEAESEALQQELQRLFEL